MAKAPASIFRDIPEDVFREHVLPRLRDIDAARLSLTARSGREMARDRTAARRAAVSRRLSDLASRATESYAPYLDDFRAAMTRVEVPAVDDERSLRRLRSGLGDLDLTRAMAVWYGATTDAVVQLVELASRSGALFRDVCDGLFGEEAGKRLASTVYGDAASDMHVFGTLMQAVVRLRTLELVYAHVFGITKLASVDRSGALWDEPVMDGSDASKRFWTRAFALQLDDDV